MDEVAEHLLRHVEVRDHAVTEGADRPDARRRAADHPLRFGADGMDIVRHVVERDDGRLEQNDPLTANVDDRVRGAEVDRDVAAAVAQQSTRIAHRRFP